MGKNKVSDYSEQIRGVSYKPEDLHEDLNDNSIVLLRANNISDGEINFEDVVYVDKSKVSDKQLLRKGDILVCASSGSKHLVGKAAQVDFNGNYTFGAFCKVVRPGNINYSYLGMYFQSREYRRIISSISQGANINNIKNENIDNLMINVPGESEQINVAEILTKVSKIIKLKREQLDLLDELIKSRFVEMFGEPEHNIKGWKIVKMEKLCRVSSSKRIYQNEQSMTGIPFLRISDLVSRMDTGSKECDLYIPKDRFEELKELGLVPKAGDILVTARGTLGRCYIIAEDDEFYFQDGMITWLSEFQDEITPLYISNLFAMPGFRKQIDGLQAGSTVAYLSISMTKKLDIMVPTIDLQNQFASFVQVIDKLKVEVQKSLSETQILFDTLMQDYFEKLN